MLHRSLWICPVCHCYIHVLLFPSMTDHLIFNKSNTTGGIGTAYHSVAPEFTPCVFVGWIRIAQFLSFCVEFCELFFIFFIFAIASLVLLLTVNSSVQHFVLLHVFTFVVSCYDFRIRTMFCWCIFLVVSKMAYVLLVMFILLHIVVSYATCLYYVFYTGV